MMTGMTGTTPFDMGFRAAFVIGIAVMIAGTILAGRTWLRRRHADDGLPPLEEYQPLFTETERPFRADPGDHPDAFHRALPPAEPELVPVVPPHRAAAAHWFASHVWSGMTPGELATQIYVVTTPHIPDWAR